MEKEKRKDNTMLIVLINTILLITYTLYIRITSNNAEDFIGLAFVIFWHCVICLILGLFWEKFRRAFLLSSLAVILIGFSTCVIAFSVH